MIGRHPVIRYSGAEIARSGRFAKEQELRKLLVQLFKARIYSMPGRKSGKIVRGAELTAVTAEKVFGWTGVHKENGELIGKKQDKAGRWRSARVPAYSSDPVHAYAIDERMKQLGRWERYERELSRVTKAQNLPSEWATPEQRSRAAIRAIASRADLF